MRLLFLGDIVGKAGRAAVIKQVPHLIDEYHLDFVVANGENAAGGFGITEKICKDILNSGVDVITLGNHAFDQREVLTFIDRQDQLIRPINYPKGTPGRGSNLFKAKNGACVLVINVNGTLFMEGLDDPFAALENELLSCPLRKQADFIFIDVHAEATSEKQCIGFYADGRATVVAGTHTHVPTADHRILPYGTAYISDVGMCGDYNSVIGMNKNESLNRFSTKIKSQRLEPASGPVTISGIIVEASDNTGLALSIAQLRLGGILESTIRSSSTL